MIEQFADVGGARTSGSGRYHLVDNLGLSAPLPNKRQPWSALSKGRLRFVETFAKAHRIEPLVSIRQIRIR
jgi:hypothetical protein